MDDLTKYLYNFVCEKRMGSIHQDPEYKVAARSVDLQTEKVEEGMSDEQLRELRLLIESIVALETLESEHFFQATLRLARELDAVAGRA